LFPSKIIPSLQIKGSSVSFAAALATLRWFVNKAWIILVGCGLFVGLTAGCSTETYRQWADADVRTLLRDRKEKALGYQPATPVDAPVPTKAVPKKAYAEIPTTPIPPSQPSPVEPERVVVPYERLGPERKWMRDWPAPDIAPDIGIAVTEQRALNRLRLGPPSPFIHINQLDLFGSLHYGIQHSRQYQDQLETLYLSALDVTLQRHLLLEPQPFATAGLTYDGRQGQGPAAPDGVALRSALNATVNAGVKQPLPYGGQVVASALVQFVDALDHETVNGESAQVALSGSIPLLRGAGMVNLEPLVNSERQLVYQVRAFEDFRRNFVVNVASQYFDLEARLQSVNDRRVNYTNTRDILDQTEALFAADRLNYLEVQRARQAVLDAQTALITAQTDYEAAVDNFKLVLGMPVTEELEVVPVALEVNVPVMEPPQAIALAEKYRLDLQTARDQIDDARRQVSNAANGLLPDLSLVASSSIGNIPGTAAKSVDGRTVQYSGGVVLDLPVDRLAERNVYRAALLNYSNAQRSLMDKSQAVQAAVRNSLRQIHTAQFNLQIQQRGTELAERRLEYSTELLRLGQVSSSRDLVEAQSSLLSAQDAYEQAKSALQVNVLQFLQTTGTLRVDPRAGTLGRVLNMTDADIPSRDGRL
jgi:outer membrane protein TolC